MGKIIEASDSVSIGQQMKNILQREAQEKIVAARKAQMSDKMASIIKVVIEVLADEPNQAIEVVLSYASALAISTDTPKEKLLEGVGKIYDQQREGYEKQLELQKNAIKAHALAAMAQKQPVHPGLMQQIEAMKIEMPQEFLDYVAAEKEAAEKPKLEAVPDAPADETKPASDETKPASDETKPAEPETPPSDDARSTRPR